MALRKKFSITMWKALSQSLSVDDHIWRIGITLVLKFECCEEGAFEDLNHVLYKGRVAVAIWILASYTLGIPYVAQRTWRESVEARFRCTQKNFAGYEFLIPIIITWSLWCWRCSACMKGKRETSVSLWRLSIGLVG